jgi:hypothetical protein
MTEINFTESADHIEITGTKYLIIPPDDSYTVSSNFHGIEGGDAKSAINITDMSMPFEQVLPMFAKDLPADQLEFEKDYMINGNSVKIYKTEKPSNPNDESAASKFWIMLYGNDKTTFTIAAMYESSRDEELSPKFEKSLLSFMYLENKEVDPQAGLGFSLDISATPLKFASIMMQTGAVYNMTGDMFNKGDDATSYMVMVMPAAVEKEEQKDQAVRAVKRPFDEHISVEEVNPISLSGLKGFEVVAYEENENKEKTLKYAVTLFDTGKYYDIRAASEIDLENRLEMFKKISRTFQLK